MLFTIIIVVLALFGIVCCIGYMQRIKIGDRVVVTDIGDFGSSRAKGTVTGITPSVYVVWLDADAHGMQFEVFAHRNTVKRLKE